MWYLMCGAGGAVVGYMFRVYLEKRAARIEAEWASIKDEFSTIVGDIKKRT